MTAWFLDLFLHDLASDLVGDQGPGLPKLVCAADMPSGPYDLAVVPLASGGEAELSREILQAAYHQLAMGGRLVAAVVRVRPGEETVAYIIEKTREAGRLRDFSCEVVFRDRERLLTSFTRPGVFAHRRIDPGARHLLNAVDVAPGTRVIDIGCGSGSVGLGIAARDEAVEVFAFDSAARAVECTRRGAEYNKLPNISVKLEAHGAVPEEGAYDLALANPPYYADFRIAQLVVSAAHRALAPGGTLLVVTKHPSWYVENLPAEWDEVAQEIVKTYHIIEAVRRG